MWILRKLLGINSIVLEDPTTEDLYTGWKFNYKQMQEVQKEAEAIYPVQIDLEVIDAILQVITK